MGIFFLFFGIGAVIGVVGALVIFGIPALMRGSVIFYKTMSTLRKICADGFKKGWNEGRG
ncbi:MAG: hypothetical protein P4N59_10805 [Negativicutes bacterium]|nr:hypothetical protein [Negativicutes bacterium]